MSPYQQFTVNRNVAEKYVEMYVELRNLKGLGQRGALSNDNKYLLWCVRAAIVSAIGALDHYVHQVLLDRIPKLFKSNPPQISQELLEQVQKVVAVKTQSDMAKFFGYLASQNGIEAVCTSLRDEVFLYQSFQAPEKVVKAFKCLGYPDILQTVADSWQGPNTQRADLARRLESYVKRRNQIAHEGDLHSGVPREITPDYARKCISFVWNLVYRMDGSVYGWNQQTQPI